MIEKYKIVTLCGSTRFKDAFEETQKRLTLEGNIVISVGLFGHSGDEEVWQTGTKEMLDDMHLRKIDLADEIFVINVGGYIGSSTSKEIEYARSIGKPVNYLEKPEQPRERDLFTAEAAEQDSNLPREKGTRQKKEGNDELSGYLIMASKNHPSYLKQFSDQCISDLSNEQTSLKISQVVLRETKGRGRCKDENLDISYLYRIMAALKAGKGRYLKYEIEFAGTDERFRGIVFEIREKSTNGLLYRIYSDVTYGKNKVMKVFVPFDPEMILPELTFEIVKLQKKNG